MHGIIRNNNTKSSNLIVIRNENVPCALICIVLYYNIRIYINIFFLLINTLILNYKKICYKLSLCRIYGCDCIGEKNVLNAIQPIYHLLSYLNKTKKGYLMY